MTDMIDNNVAGDIRAVDETLEKAVDLAVYGTVFGAVNRASAIQLYETGTRI